MGDKTNTHHRAVKFFLDLIQRYCLDEKLPPLTILVVNNTGSNTGRPGTGFIAWDIDRFGFEEGVKKVFNFNWNDITNPFSYASEGETQTELVRELIEDPSKSGDVYARVKVRGIGQHVFRNAMLKI